MTIEIKIACFLIGFLLGALWRRRRIIKSFIVYDKVYYYNKYEEGNQKIFELEKEIERLKNGS